MPRRILAAVAAFSFALVWSAPAYADSTVKVRSLPDPNNLANPFVMAWGCSGGPWDPSLQLAFKATDNNPAPTLGDGSWGLEPLTGSGGNEFGPGVDVPSSADLSTFQVKVNGVTAGQAMIEVSPPDISAGTAEVWVGLANVMAPSGGWQTVSVPTSTSYSWQLYDYSTGSMVAVGGPTSATLAGFDAAHGAATDYFAGLLFGCPLGAGQSYYYDAFAWGASGSVTTYDFDKFSTSATSAAGPTTVTAGGAATISGRTSWSSSMLLQQRKYGSSTWQDVGAVTGGTADSAGVRTFTATVRPLVQTSYRWYVAPASCCLAAYSSPVTVKVRTAVTLKLADSTLRKGQSLVASGTTKPHKPGVTVTLWRKTATGASLLASSKVHADGTYRISHRVGTKGTWKVFVKVAAASGNLAGQSPVRSATVG